MIEPFRQDGFDGNVLGIIKIESPPASGLKPGSAVFLGKPDDSLGSSQIIQDPVGKKRFDEAFTVRADCFRLLEAPLGIAHQISHGLRGQMVGYGRFFTGPMFPGMNRHQFVVVKDFDRGFPVSG